MTTPESIIKAINVINNNDNISAYIDIDEVVQRYDSQRSVLHNLWDYDVSEEDFEEGLDDIRHSSGSDFVSLGLMLGPEFVSKQEMINAVNGIDLDDYITNQIECIFDDVEFGEYTLFAADVSEFSNYFVNTIQKVQKVFHITDDDIAPFIKNVKKALSSEYIYYDISIRDMEEDCVSNCMKEASVKAFQKHQEDLLSVVCDEFINDEKTVETAILDLKRDAMRCKDKESFLYFEHVQMFDIDTFFNVLSALDQTDQYKSLSDTIFSDYESILNENWRYCVYKDFKQDLYKDISVLEQHGISINEISQKEEENSMDWLDGETEEQFWGHEI